MKVMVAARRGRSAADDAGQVAAYLEAIRRSLRQAVLDATRQQSLQLTAPQMRAVQILVDESRDTGAGLSLSELSARMGLAHSTVSGVVTRLERRGMVRRTNRSDDRRFIRIELTDPVQEWLDRDLAGFRFRPLAAALDRATPAERAAVMTGLETLHRLLPPDGQS